MKCGKCGKEVGNLFCGNCRAEIEKEGLPRDMKMISIFFYIPERKTYVAGCMVLECPWNRGGYCNTEQLSLESLKALMHEWDGDNCIHQACG